MNPKSPSLPANIARDLDIEIGMATNGIIGDAEHGYVLFEDRRPSPVMIERLRARLDDLEFIPAGHRPSDLSRDLSRLFSVLPAHGSDAGMRSQVYIEELADLPLAALSAVIGRYIRGDISNEKWLPTIGEIRKEVSRMIQPFERERATITKVLEFWGNADARPDVRIIPANTSQKHDDRSGRVSSEQTGSTQASE